jgi:hypothetical protein
MLNLGDDVILGITSGVWLIGHSVVSFFPIDKFYLDALKWRADATGAVVVLEKWYFEDLKK